MRHHLCDSFSIDHIWDGESVNSENVSKWVGFEIKSIPACMGVNFSCHENEVINLLSRIEKNSVIPKPTVQITPPATRRQKEFRRLELGVNYDRACSFSSEMMVSYV